MSQLPVADLVPLVDIASPDATSREALDTACRDHGFFLLTGHGLDDLITHTWAETARFFDAPRSVRVAIERDEVNPLGWFDRELTKRKRDNKEVFDYIDPSNDSRDRFNRWPDLDGFHQSMTEFFDAFSDLTNQTVSLLHEVLGLGSDSQKQMIGDPLSSAVRLNHYPIQDPVPIAEREGLPELGETALGYHTDPGTLTLLLQDNVGGLQADSATHGWVDVVPKPGTIVVNLGDMMQVWTNDQYRAAVHRVVPMTKQRRFSIPYFSNPPRDAIVAPLPELSTDSKRYSEVGWAAFMKARSDDNFADLGTSDTQISDFRIGR